MKSRRSRRSRDPAPAPPPLKMQRPSLSMAMTFLAVIVLLFALLLPSNSSNTTDDQSYPAASAAAAKRGGGNGNGKPELIIVNLVGRGGDTISLAMLPHDLSLAGFSNGSHHWFVFPGHEHVITNGTTLPFGNSYKDLIGGLANLPTLPLGREPVLDAMAVISSTASTDAEDDDDNKLVALKRAVATLTVTKSEALRLTPVKDAVAGGWETGDARLTEAHLRYIEHWDTISFEILRAHKNGGVWDGPFTELLKETVGIHSMEEALAVVGTIASPTLAQVLMAHASSA